MEGDFLKDLEDNGLVLRLKRLSDSLNYGIKEYYKRSELGIEYHWHVTFKYLKKHKMASMTEIAQAIGSSQPATIKMINKMKEQGYIDFAIHPLDSRRQILQLSKKTIKEWNNYEKHWKNSAKVMEELLQKNKRLMDQLSKLEEELHKKPLKERFE